MSPVTPARRVSPPAVLAATLAVTIVAGSFVLWLPISQAGAPISWLDALFTAASATCVTGLVVVDIGSRLSVFGQGVVLLLVQVGGLGVMTIGTIVVLALGQRPTLLVRHFMQGFGGQQPAIRARDLFATVVLTTFTVEALGAVALFFAFARDYEPRAAAWLAVFHSVSAFCNAGLALWPDSLGRFAADPFVNLVVMSLIVTGGLGFIVLAELLLRAKASLRGEARIPRLSLHTRIVLTATAVAIVLGAVLILLLEADASFVGRPLTDRLWIAAFQSVTTRTAGFTTVDLNGFSNPTLLVVILLMFVGGAPGSMAGGIKVTGAAAVLLMVAQRLRGRDDIGVFGRSIGAVTLERAVIVSVLAVLLITAAVCAIEVVRSASAPTMAGRGELFAVLFESVSAYGTVGLSMGLTTALAWPSKMVLVALMFVGRLGPLTLMDFFAHRAPPPPVRRVSEELMVG